MFWTRPGLSLSMAAAWYPAPRRTIFDTVGYVHTIGKQRQVEKSVSCMFDGLYHLVSDYVRVQCL